MLTIASTTISVLIALIALREAQQANDRATAAEKKAMIAESAAMNARVIHYHAPKPGGKTLRLPDFIEQLEAQNANKYNSADYSYLADASAAAHPFGFADDAWKRAAGDGA